MPGPLPYQHLNLRKNPFGDFSEDERTTLAVVEIDDVLRLLQSPRAVVQYVGEKGYGKTTHLLAIRSCTPGSRYVHIPEGERVKLPTGDPILIDEAQRLTLWQRRQLFRGTVPLVLGTHRNFEAALRRVGRSVTTIHVQDSTSANRLHTLLNARIEWVRRGPGEVPTVTIETAQQLFARFGPNVRGMLGELYGVVEGLRHVGDI